jgi:hypothetical protein
MYRGIASSYFVSVETAIYELTSIFQWLTGKRQQTLGWPFIVGFIPMQTWNSISAHFGLWEREIDFFACITLFGRMILM